MAILDFNRKIILLEFLSKADGYVSNNDITHFFLEYSISDYFDVQLSINSLVEADLLSVRKTHNLTSYRINENGINTLSLFSDRISDEMRADIADYITKRCGDIKKTSSLTAIYDKHTSGGYICILKKTENNNEQMHIELRVHSKEQADAICTNWKYRHEDVYASLMDTLV